MWHRLAARYVQRSVRSPSRCAFWMPCVWRKRTCVSTSMLCCRQVTSTTLACSSRCAASTRRVYLYVCIYVYVCRLMSSVVIMSGRLGMCPRIASSHRPSLRRRATILSSSAASVLRSVRPKLATANRNIHSILSNAAEIGRQCCVKSLFWLCCLARSGNPSQSQPIPANPSQSHPIPANPSQSQPAPATAATNGCLLPTATARTARHRRCEPRD